MAITLAQDYVSESSDVSGASYTTTGTFGGVAGDIIIVSQHTSDPADGSTIAWTGGTPANATAFALIGRKTNTDTINRGGVAVWAAICTGTVTATTIDSSYTIIDFDFVAIKVRRYAGANTASGVVANAIAATTLASGFTATTPQVTINATAAGSLLLFPMTDFNYGTLATLANSTLRWEDDNPSNNGSHAYWYELTAATSGAGNVTIGATSTTGSIWGGVGFELLAASAVTVAEGPWGAPISSVLTNTTPTFSTSASGVLLAFVNADGSSGNTCTGVSGAGLTWAKCGGGAPPDDTTSLSEIWWAYASTTLSNVTVTADVSTSSNFGLTIVRLAGAHPIAPVGKTLGPLIHGRGANDYYLGFTGLNVGSMLFGAGFPENYIGPGAATGTTIIDAQNGVAIALRSTSSVAATTESIGLSYGSNPAKGSRFGVEIKPDEPVLISSFPASTTAQGAALTGTTTFASNTFSTTGLKTIVVTAAYNSFDTGSAEITLTWTGGTPANATGFTKLAICPGSYLQSGVWVATTTGDLTTVGVTITQTGTAGTTDSALIAVYVFDTDKGVAGFGTPFRQFQDGPPVALPYAATLNTTPGSYVLAVTCTGGEQGFVNNPISGQTAVASAQAPGADWCAAAYRRATGTSTSIGWGSGVNESIWQSFIAVEYRGDLVPGFPLSDFRM